MNKYDYHILNTPWVFPQLHESFSTTCAPGWKKRRTSRKESIIRDVEILAIVKQQTGKEEGESGQSEEKSQPEPQTSRQTPSQPGSSAPLCLQEPEEERLQRLRTRIKSTRAKMQARQTIMVTFPSQLKSPGHQGEPGPREAASAQNLHRLPGAPAHPGERGRKRDPAKRPAPLMAKALKDYGRRFSRKWTSDALHNQNACNSRTQMDWHPHTPLEEKGNLDTSEERHFPSFIDLG